MGVMFTEGIRCWWWSEFALRSATGDNPYALVTQMLALKRLSLLPSVSSFEPADEVLILLYVDGSGDLNVSAVS